MEYGLWYQEWLLVEIHQVLKRITVFQMSELLPGGSALSETLGPAIYSPETYTQGRVGCLWRGLLSQSPVSQEKTAAHRHPPPPQGCGAAHPSPQAPPFGLLPASGHRSLIPHSTSALHSPSLSSVSSPAHQSDWVNTKPKTQPPWFGSNKIGNKLTKTPRWQWDQGSPFQFHVFFKVSFKSHCLPSRPSWLLPPSAKTLSRDARSPYTI